MFVCVCVCVCVCVVVSHTCTTQRVATRRKIRLIESNAKCHHLKKGTLREAFICLRPPPLLSICLGWSNNFVGSESGQIQRVKLLQNLVSNRTQHSPPPPSHTLKGGGEVNQRRSYRGNSSQSWVENTNMTRLYLQSINSNKHLPQSPFTGQVF